MKVSLHPCYLIPKTTTEKPQFISASAACPIRQTIDERVIIIGPDIYRDSDLVGSFDLVICMPYTLPTNQACMQVCLPGPNVGHASYFMDTLLCCSHPDT